MNKERIVIFILCFLLLLIGFLLTLGFKDSKECIGNPFIYGISKLETLDTGNIYCTCSFSSPGYAPFYFNNKEVNVLTSNPIN